MSFLRTRSPLESTRHHIGKVVAPEVVMEVKEGAVGVLAVGIALIGALVGTLELVLTAVVALGCTKHVAFRAAIADCRRAILCS